MKGVLRGIAIVAGLSAASMTHAFTIYRVGSDAACTHSTIQAAIDDAANSSGEDYVAIASNQDYGDQHLNIDNQDIDVVGGFTDCSDDDPELAATTVSGGGSGGAVFSVSGTSHAYFSNLWIRDGAGGANHGGGIDFHGAGSLQVVQTTLSLNSAEFGAGIRFDAQDSAELRISHDTLILSNTAERWGGGIIVFGSARLFVLEPQTYIAFNSAGVFGGGIAVLAPAIADIGSSGYNGAAVVNFNNAQNGGGIAVVGVGFSPHQGLSATARFFSTDPNAPVQISGNTASDAGGGIWLKTSNGASLREDARLCALDFRINDNIASQGAAIYADRDGSESTTSAVGPEVLFNHTSQYDADCQSPEPVETLGAISCAPGIPCNELSGNVAENDAGDSSGAIILLHADADLYGLRFRMYDNRGKEMIRSYTDVEGEPAVVNTTDLSRCLITHNEVGNSVIRQPLGSADTSALSVDECTVDGNSIANNVVMDVGETLTSLTRDILHQPGALTLVSTSLDHVTATQILSNDIASLPTSTFNVEGSPTFVDAEGGNYHLSCGSLGIDFATDSGHFVDLDANTRNVDLPLPNMFGSQDLGALETQDGCSISDVIFQDGFDFSLRIESVH